MKNLLSSLIFSVLFLGLAALAFLSVPRGGVSASAVPEEVNSAPVANSETESVLANNWNNISMPLITGISTADAVATHVGGVVQVARYDAASQSLVIRNVGSPFGVPNYPVNTGDWLLLLANTSAPTVATFVGDVPAPAAVSFSLMSGWNGISLPLDQASITTADALGTAIGTVNRVARWDAASQSLVIRNVGSPFGVPNFPVSIGYPYLVNSSTATTFP